MTTSDTYLVDGVSAIAIHNGVARIQFMRLSIDGKPVPTVEIQVPVLSVKSVIDALRKVPGAA